MKKNSFSFYKDGGKPEKVTGDFTTKKRGAIKKE
jgi:hypothetical protein